jgi:hypothetical protein
MEQQNNTVWWIVGVVVVLIIGGVWFFSSRDSATNDGENGGEETLLPTSGRISVDNQYPGKIVYVSSATLPKDGFVVIHKDNAGTAGAIIGSKAFKKGTNPGTVELTEATVNGGTYYAMLHEDNGDGVFNAATDMPLKDAQGNVIMKMFKVTTDIQPIKG